MNLSVISWPAVGLLVLSNLLMAYAWYGHLKNMGDAPLWKVILVSWLIAGFEYVFMIPANRIGARTMSLEQLKITQEVLSLLIFVPFSLLVMDKPISWNYVGAAACIFGAVLFIFRS